MAFAKFKTASVRGIVTAIPPVEKCIDDEAELYGGNPRQMPFEQGHGGVSSRYGARLALRKAETYPLPRTPGAARMPVRIPGE